MSIVDQGSVLLVVYAAFSIGVTHGLWTAVPPSRLLVVVVVSSALLAVVLGAFFALGALMRLPREDAIVLLFCGSKKSQVSGPPMATLLFPAAQVGMYVLPLMIFHILQPLVCAMLANRYAASITAPRRFDTPNGHAVGAFTDSRTVSGSVPSQHSTPLRPGRSSRWKTGSSPFARCSE